MTIDAYTLAIFAAGIGTGVAIDLLVRATADGVFIIRYLRQHPRHPERRRATGTPPGPHGPRA
jgi:hypothetical protein